MNDDELLEALRLRARATPRTVVGAIDKPKAFPPTSQDALTHVDSQLGFRLPLLLRRIFVEVADRRIWPGLWVVSDGRAAIERTACPRLSSRLEKNSRTSQVACAAAATLRLGLRIWSCVDCRAGMARS